MGTCFFCFSDFQVGHIAGQIIATSHDLGHQKVANWKGIPHRVLGSFKME